MGYAQTTILMWGIVLTEEESKKVYSETYEKAQENYYEEPPGFDREEGYLWLCSMGTDSRINSLHYDEGFQSVFGVFLACQGYTDHGDFARILNGGIQDSCKTDGWNNAKEILWKCGITPREPSLLMCSQVW